ncbi:MAG: hypothetical protein EBQ92_00185 [Proteobacteria bacterium]|nr:hypothetical protein [Pseudomonadota bacterium]
MSNIDPNFLIDPTCAPTGLNPSLFPVGSAQHLDPSYNLLPFLCNLLNVTVGKDVNPILASPTSAFDITPYTDFSMLNGVGDPRVSLGEVMTKTYVEFLPRVITQTEVRQNGGTQVIDNYICTADGTPIKLSETIPVLLSLDLTGKKPYQYGAITVPPISATYEELMKPIDPNEVRGFIKKYVSGAKNASASAFTTFIKKYFPDWTATVDLYQTPSCLIVTLSLGEELVYINYYPDVAVDVGCLLGIQSINQHVQSSTFGDYHMSMVMGAKIPDYKVLLNDKKASDEHYQYIINNFKTIAGNNYNNIFTNITANTAAYLDSFHSFFGSMSSNFLKQESNSISVNCNIN